MWFKRNKKDDNEDSLDYGIVFEIEQEILLKDTHLFSYCDKCKENTYYFVNSNEMEGNRLLSCKRCQYECSDVWCEKCGMGGDFVYNLGERPERWTCTECNTTYTLDESFYENKITMYPESMITRDIKKKLK